MSSRHLLFFVTEDWYFVSHRLGLAIAARHMGMDVTVVTRIREHGDVIARAGIRVIPFEIARSGTNPLREIVTLARLIQLYRRERPDVVHHVAMKPVLYGALAARATGVHRQVNALAGMGWLFTSKSGVARAIKPFVRGALRLALRGGVALVQNPDDEEMLVQIGVARSQVRRIAGSGIDLNQYQVQDEAPGCLVVVLPSRLLWDKGVGEFVSAARELKARGSTARFVLAGEPDAQNPATVPTEQIQAWVTEGVVEHLGWVTNMPALLAASHVVCLPSYREGLPRSLLEAAAAGRAIVTTDVPGCRELVTDGENGLLVPARDAHALALAIERLVTDADLRAACGARNRKRAENEFASEVVIPQTLALYEGHSSTCG
ncbi:MAG: glycosyltransferase family 4 protein [Gemmatimonadaceae bacterium]